MSISSELTALDGYILGAYDEINDKGGTVPQNKNMANLATAISSIPSGGGGGINREANNAGVYGAPSSSFEFSLPSNATNLATYSLYYAFYGCLGVTSADMHTLTSITDSSAMGWAFCNCSALASVDLRSLRTVSGQSSMQNAFQGCRGLTSVNLSSLTTVSGSQCMNAIFSGCSLLTSIDLGSLTTLSATNCMANAFSRTGIASINFSSLSSITGAQSFSGAFSNCGSLKSLSFPSLSSVTGSQAFSSAFATCSSLQSLSFPSLTPSSFGSNTNQFNRMLRYCSNVTVHFPASIQSTIGSWADVTSGFGGTNTTVLFDL